MNYPQQPGYYPPQPQQPQQPAYPQQQPPQQQPQQGAPPLPTAGYAAQAQQQAMEQIWQEAASQPKRQPINRDKPHDSTNIAQVISAEFKPSQKDGRLFLLITYRVLESTVESMKGREYAYTLFLSTRPQIQEASDLAKEIWGMEAVQQWAAQKVPMQDIVAYIAQAVTGKYVKITVKRNTKNGSIPYEDGYPNHQFNDFSDRMPAWQAPPAGYQPQAATGAAPMPMPGQAPQGAPPQPQQPPAPTPQQQPAAPAAPPMPGQAPPQPQGAPVPPQNPQPAPAAPMPGSMPQGAPQPQQPPQQPPGGALPPPQMFPGT